MQQNENLHYTKMGDQDITFTLQESSEKLTFEVCRWKVEIVILHAIFIILQFIYDSLINIYRQILSDFANYS
jgi:hypothetical protein